MVCSTTKDKVLPLRTFIQETLRRSRTSYSTLQVALYYLIVIRPHLPPRDCDISNLPAEEAQVTRAKQCGRRMFLAALILASKYLQDRNYSARAWSKISGLNTQEININEMAFLDAVNWRLHISETNFQKWTDLVLKYTTDNNPSPISPARPWVDEEERKREWCDLVMKLSPNLSEAELSSSGGLTPCAVDADIVASTSPLAIDPFPPAFNVVGRPAVAQAALTSKRSFEQSKDTNSHAFDAPQPPQRVPTFRRSMSSSHIPSSMVAPAAGTCRGRGSVLAEVPSFKPHCSAMSSVAKVAKASMLSGFASETFPLPTRRGSGGLSSSMVTVPHGGYLRRSSLSTSVSRPGPVGSPAFQKGKQSYDLSKLVFGSVVPPPSPGVHGPLAKSCSSSLCTSPWRASDHQMTPCVSPKSREAALSLNMLKENYSPCSSGSTTPTSLSRKRSCPEGSAEGRPARALRMEANANGHAVDGTTSVTPKFRSLAGFRSPSMGYGSPTRSPALDRSKRLRCAVEKIGGMGMIEGMSVAQNVR